MLTTEQVAKKLRITRQHVNYLIRAKRLKGVHIGRDYFVNESDLGSYVPPKAGRPAKK